MYVLEFLLEDKNNSYKYFEKVFWCKFKIQNVLISYAVKQIKKLQNDDAYIQAREDYKTMKDSGSDRNKITTVMNGRIAYYGLTKGDFEKYAKPQQWKYKKYISSETGQVIAKDVFSAVRKCLYGNGKKIHYKKLDSIHTVSAKSLKNGILLDTEHEVCHFGLKKKGIDCHFIIKDYNKWARNCYLKDKDKVKFCRLARKQFNTGYKYYIQFIIDGEPIQKHGCGEGKCGIDPGISTVAAVADDKCFLEMLAADAARYNKDIVECQKALERSRRVNNPACYNKDGTVKKGSRFKKTKKYKKLLKKFRTLHRKRVFCIKQSHDILANRILECCNNVVYEGMDFSALGRKSRNPAERNDKVSEVKNKDGAVKKIKKFRKKRRFGKSLQNRSPGLFLEILKRKCIQHGFMALETNTKTFKASQYNHLFDDYRKKELDQRWNVLYDEGYETVMIQRDLYSAFLIKNADSSLKHTDRNQCMQGFGKFIRMHDECIGNIIESGTARLSCFGF